MTPPKKKGLKGHDLARTKLCVVCLRRSKKKLSQNHINGLKEHSKIFETLSPEDQRVPTGICDGCRTTLLLKMSGKGKDRLLKFPLNFDFISDVTITATSSDEICSCLLCDLASRKGNPKHVALQQTMFLGEVTHLNVSAGAEPGSLAIEQTTLDSAKFLSVEEPQKDSNEKDLCSKCFSEKGENIDHVCNDSTALENFKAFRENKPILAESFAAYVIKSTPPSPNGTRRLSQLHGQKLPVCIGASKPLPKAVPLHELAQFAQERQLSQRQTNALGAFLRKNNVQVEVGLQKDLVARNHLLDGFMEVKKLHFLIDNKLVEKPMICVKNASDFVFHIFKLRKQNYHDFIIKEYFDNGQDYLKLCVSLIPRNWKEIAQKKGRNWNGVNTVLVLGIANKVPENHTNVHLFYKAVNIWSIKAIKCIDHKMKNIVCGLMSNACSYPCLHCLVHKSQLSSRGPERTVPSLAENYEKFISEGKGDRKFGKFYFCQTDQPLLFETMQEHKDCTERISDFIVPSALHIWLGLGNQFLQELGELCPNLVEQWVKDSGVSAAGYWQGTYLGNALRDLFENISFFEDEFGNARFPWLPPYLTAMKSLNAVRKACFGLELHDDYADRIRKFQADFLVLDEDFQVSTLVKGHDVFHHIIEWLNKWQLPLGLVSEQAGEDIHKRLRKFMQDKQVASPDSENYGPNLLIVMIAWNSLAAIEFE